MATTPLRFLPRDLMPVPGDSTRMLLAKHLASLQPDVWNVGLALASRTTTAQTANITRGPFKKVVLNLTVSSAGVAGVKVWLLGYNSQLGTNFQLFCWSAVAANATYVFTAGEGAETANQNGNVAFGSVIASAFGMSLPDKFAIMVQAQDANPMTYELDYCLIP